MDPRKCYCHECRGDQPEPSEAELAVWRLRVVDDATGLVPLPKRLTLAEQEKQYRDTLAARQHRDVRDAALGRAISRMGN